MFIMLYEQFILIHKWLFQFSYSVERFLLQTFKSLEGKMLNYIKYERIKLSQTTFFITNFMSLYKMNKTIS